MQLLWKNVNSYDATIWQEEREKIANNKKKKTKKK